MSKIQKIILLSLLTVGQLHASEMGKGLLSSLKPLKEDPTDKFYLNAKASAGQAFWNPGLSEEDPNTSSQLVSYETEGLGYGAYKVDMGYNSISFFEYSVISPLSNSSTQEELLQTNSSSESGIEGYTYGISLEVLVDFLDIRNKLVSTLLTYKLQKTDNAFYGLATAQQDLTYTEGIQTYNMYEGDSLFFKTTFEEERHTFSMRYLSNRYANVRVGMYDSRWSKPTSKASVTNSSGSEIIPVDYASQGIAFSMSNYETLKHAGINYTFGLDYGLNNALSTKGQLLDVQMDEDEDLSYSALNADISFKYIPLKTDSQEFSLIAGAMYDYKSWGLSDGNEDTEDANLDAETLFSFYLTLEYQFML